METYKTRNEIDLRRLELEERRLELEESKEPQKDRRFISPADHVYDIPNFETTKGEKSKNKYQERTMEMYNHYEDEENHEMEKTQLQENPFQYQPGNKFMGSTEEENIQQDFQFPDRKTSKEEQETMKNKAEEAKQVRGRTVQNSKYNKKYPTHNTKDSWKDNRKNQQEREYTFENNRKPNLARLPPKLEGTNIITELQRVGFKTNQEERPWQQDEELRTQMEIKKLRDD